MARGELIDVDVLLIALAGFPLIILTALPLTIASPLSGEEKLYVLLAGIFLEAGASAIHFGRRDKRTIQFEILKFLAKSHAFPGGNGVPPTRIQQHVGASTKNFTRYLGDLVKKGFVAWTEEMLVLSPKGIAIIKDQDVADFFEDGKDEFA